MIRVWLSYQAPTVLRRLLFSCLFAIIPFSITHAQESNVKSTTVVFETNQGNIE